MIQIEVDEDRIGEFCRKHRIRGLSFFGSVLREDIGAESDVDVLVEFEEGYVPGSEFFEMAAELTEMLGRPVDLVRKESLRNPFRRDEILRTRQMVNES